MNMNHLMNAFGEVTEFATRCLHIHGILSCKGSVVPGNMLVAK